MFLRRRREAIAACVLAALCPSAASAEPARIFRLPAEPLDSALLRFAVQARVSIGGFPLAGCSGESRPVSGVLKPAAALRRLLPPDCGFQRVDSRAYRIVALGAPQAPRAPDPTTGQTTGAVEIAELLVTAEKRHEPLRGSPFAVGALDGPTIERLGATSLSDVASQLAGVAETNLGPGRNKIFIRGLSDGAFTGRTQSTVGLYLDEVPITYNAPDPDLRLTDVERVEVLRGPQGTLYGAGSTGGIVRIVTRAPNLASFDGSVAVEGMFNQHGDHSFGGEAVINAPVLQGRGAVRGVAYIDELAGYLDNPVRGLEDVNRGHRAGQRLSALVDLPGDWEAQAGLARQSIKSDDSQYVQGGGRLKRDAHIAEPHDNDFSMVGGRLEHHGSEADFRLSAAYIDHDLSTRYDATGAFDLGASQIAAYDENTRVELLVAEFIATSTSETRLRWLAGAFASRSRESTRTRLDASAWGGPSRAVFNRSDRLEEAAVYGELTYDVTARITATLGGRLFATRVRTLARDFEISPTPIPQVDGRLTDRGFNPKVRISYAFRPDRVIYLQAQDGFRTGGFNVPAQADGMPGGPDVATYRPDRLRSFEIGGEATLLHRALTVRIAGYLADWRDVQTDQFRASGLPVTLNIGDGRNSGVEFEAAWQPNSHWRVRASGLVNDPELTRSTDVFLAKVDIGLPGVAKRTGAFDVAYGWNVRSRWRAEIGLQGAYVGRSFLTFDGGSASKMGGYAVARLAGSLQSADWRLDAYIDNLTDEAGDTFSFGNPFSRARSRQATPLPPRTFGLAIRRSF